MKNDSYEPKRRLPKYTSAVGGLTTAPPDGSGNKGIVCITNDGNMWIDTNSSDGVCN